MRLFLQLLKGSFFCFSAFALVACGPAVRTADGDCYYRGKGILQLGATLLDGLSAYADAMQEQQYQRDQIALQQLGNKLDAIDTDTLQSDDEILFYNNDVDEYNRLLERINDYKDQKEKRLKDGPTESFSKKVDESGDCQ